MYQRRVLHGPPAVTIIHQNRPESPLHATLLLHMPDRSGENRQAFYSGQEVLRSRNRAHSCSTQPNWISITSNMPSVSKLAETLALPGFYFPPETDLPLRSSYRGCLHSHRYIPGRYKAATAEWHKARVGVNLRIVFEAICHFSEFPHTDEFWEHVEGIVKTYCQGRKAYLQQRWQRHETHPALIPLC